MRYLLPALLFPPAAPAQQGFDCHAAPPRRQFDFWLGQWEVRDTAGTLQGRNTRAQRTTGQPTGEALTQRPPSPPLSMNT